jgi:hypothetical protein
VAQSEALAHVVATVLVVVAVILAVVALLRPATAAGPDRIYEVKLAPHLESLPSLIRRTLPRLRDVQADYEQITGRQSTVVLVLVTPKKPPLGSFNQIMQRATTDYGSSLDFKFLDFEDIGYQPPSIGE